MDTLTILLPRVVQIIMNTERQISFGKFHSANMQHHQKVLLCRTRLKEYTLRLFFTDWKLQLVAKFMNHYRQKIHPSITNINICPSYNRMQNVLLIIPSTFNVVALYFARTGSCRLTECRARKIVRARKSI